MIANSRRSDYNMDSPHQYQWKFIVKSLENMDIDLNPLTPISDQERISRNSVVWSSGWV